MATTASQSGLRDWWLRTLLILQRPRPVFVALRDERPESLSDRAEPVLLIVLLAGIATVLSSGSAGHLLDGGARDGLDVAVWAFLAGGIYGVFGYFALGGILHGAVKALGSQGSYRRTRQLLAFAAMPIALSLLLWPFKLALYGEDVFRRGGSDAGAGSRVFGALELAFVVWAGLLLVTGVRSVHGWTWARAAAATGLALGVPVVVGLGLSSL